jgi:hypothetical protein
MKEYSSQNTVEETSSEYNIEGLMPNFLIAEFCILITSP